MSSATTARPARPPAAAEAGGARALSERAYVALLGGLVSLGLLMTAAVAALTYAWRDPDLVLVLAAGLGLPLLGIVLSAKSADWRISLLGYALVAAPLGALAGPAAARFDLGSVVLAIATTLLVSIGLAAAGAAAPAVVRNWEGAVVAALLVLLCAPVTGWVIAGVGGPRLPTDLWHWLGALLFGGLIFYDLNKALQRDRTPDAAVDAAVGIYLDVLNLFLRVLHLLGDGDD